MSVFAFSDAMQITFATRNAGKLKVVREMLRRKTSVSRRPIAAELIDGPCITEDTALAASRGINGLPRRPYIYNFSRNWDMTMC
ncbi:hypothetical protein C8Q74DRAFT_1294678 [Fomes fomentarius]|nr:hypothetical protein C8Q74DRAFT_1294678 [Fomes fomentarius]